MRRTILLLVGAYMSACPATHAAFFHYTENEKAISFYLNGDFQNGMFNAILFKAEAMLPNFFTNSNSGLSAGVPRPAGQPFTYPNRMLTVDRLDFPGGLGLIMFTLANNSSELSFAVGKLDGTISTASQPNGDLFLGNVNMEGFRNCFWSAQVDLLLDGVTIAQHLILPLCPEPSTASLLLSGLVGALAVNRRGSSQPQLRVEQACAP